MQKPKSYSVFNVYKVLDWIEENYEVSKKQVDEFPALATEYLGDQSTIVYLTTDDCKKIPLLLEVLKEFGSYEFTNRGGVDQFEVYLEL